MCRTIPARGWPSCRRQPSRRLAFPAPLSEWDFQRGRLWTLWVRPFSWGLSASCRTPTISGLTCKTGERSSSSFPSLEAAPRVSKSRGPCCAVRNAKRAWLTQRPPTKDGCQSWLASRVLYVSLVALLLGRGCAVALLTGGFWVVLSAPRRLGFLGALWLTALATLSGGL